MTGHAGVQRVSHQRHGADAGKEDRCHGAGQPRHVSLVARRGRGSVGVECRGHGLGHVVAMGGGRLGLAPAQDQHRAVMDAVLRQRSRCRQWGRARKGQLVPGRRRIAGTAGVTVVENVHDRRDQGGDGHRGGQGQVDGGVAGMNAYAVQRESRYRQHWPHGSPSSFRWYSLVHSSSCRRSRCHIMSSNRGNGRDFRDPRDFRDR